MLLQVAPAVSPWARSGVGMDCSGLHRPCSPVAQSEAFSEFFLVIPPRSLGEVGASCSWLHNLHSPVARSGALTGLLQIALGWPSSKSQGLGWSIKVLGPRVGAWHRGPPSLDSMWGPGVGSWDAGSQ